MTGRSLRERELVRFVGERSGEVRQYDTQDMNGGAKSGNI